jgi:hypothetical protein
VKLTVAARCIRLRKSCSFTSQMPMTPQKIAGSAVVRPYSSWYAYVADMRPRSGWLSESTVPIGV